MTEQHVKPGSTSKAGELARAAWQSVTFLHCTVVVLAVALTVALPVATVSRPVPQALLVMGKTPLAAACPTAMYRFSTRINEIAVLDQPVTAESPTVAVTGHYDRMTGHPEAVNVITTKGAITSISSYRLGDKASALWAVPAGVSRVQITQNLQAFSSDTVINVCVATGPL